MYRVFIDRHYQVPMGTIKRSWVRAIVPTNPRYNMKKSIEPSHTKKPSIFSSKEICSWPSDILFLDCPYSYQIPVYRVLSVGCRGASRIVVWWLDHFRKPFTINFNAYVELIFQSNNKIVYFIFYFKVTMAPGLP